MKKTELENVTATEKTEDDPNTTTYTWDTAKERYVKKYPKPRIMMQIGLDVGQLIDWTALIVNKYNETDGTHNIERIERWKHIPYPEVINIVSGIVNEVKKRRGHWRFLIDITGVGRPLADRFWREHIDVTGVTITGGDTVTKGASWQHEELHIPKESLVGNFNLLLNGDMVGWGDAPKNGDLLTREVHKFRQKISKSANLQFGAETGSHDDLLTAAMLATWEGQIKPYACVF